MKTTDKIFIAGHKGMVGSAIQRILEQEGYVNIITADRSEVDLTNQQQVFGFFEQHKPQFVFLAAAKVGGVMANMKYQADFIYENLCIQNNVIFGAFKNQCEKLLFLGSSCIFPRDCPQPMKEEYLLTGKLEPTNEGYAVAKIAGLKLTEYLNRQYGFNAISVMPPNLYGPNDSFHPEHSHVLSALVRKFCDAVANGGSSVDVWGTGSARREFMHVDDLAKGAIFAMRNYNSPEFINIGTAEEVSIKELAELVMDVTGFEGNIVWDTTKPDGMPLKCLDVSKMLEMGFRPSISLREGVVAMVSEYRGLTGKFT